MKPIIIISHDQAGKILSAAVPAKKFAGQVHLVPNEHEHVVEVDAARNTGFKKPSGPRRHEAC
jgi:hypothetical protein